jgi:hypothetical protein
MDSRPKELFGPWFRLEPGLECILDGLDLIEATVNETIPSLKNDVGKIADNIRKCNKLLRQYKKEAGISGWMMREPPPNMYNVDDDQMCDFELARKRQSFLLHRCELLFHALNKSRA